MQPEAVQQSDWRHHMPNVCNVHSKLNKLKIIRKYQSYIARLSNFSHSTSLFHLYTIFLLFSHIFFSLVVFVCVCALVRATSILESNCTNICRRRGQKTA